MKNPLLIELEQQFRNTWRHHARRDFHGYLNQVPQDERVELLGMLLSAELELAYQPGAWEPDAPTIAEEDERTKPRIQLLLAMFPELKQREDLVLQLVMLEVALRLRFDNAAVNFGSYIDLCPQGKDRIEILLDVMHSSANRKKPALLPVLPVNSSETTVTEAASPQSMSLHQLPCNLGFFLLTDVIGKGGMGYVYAGIDLRSAAHVAVKVMRRMDSWSIYRFNEEFSWLSRLVHPHIVKLYDAFSEGDVRYFSMEMVEGSSIRCWYQMIENQSDAWSRLTEVLGQAASAICFLHENGVVHRDIKSSNVMITRQERAIVLDMGLAFRVSMAQNTLRSIDGFKIVGTLQYLPPETLDGKPPSFEGDWYSFGVMIFETITGEYPPIHVVEDADDSKRRRYVVDRPALNRLTEHWPSDLASLCTELLSVDPVARPRGYDVAVRLGGSVPTRAFEPSSEECFWREESWEFLDRAYEVLACGDRALRLLRGDSGLGKSTLVTQWLQCRTAANSDWLVLNVRCHRQDHSPLRALNLLVQEMVTQLANEPVEFWRDLLAEGGGELAHAFPQIERLTSIPWPHVDAASSPVEAAARRAAGLHSLLGWLTGLSQKRKLAIIIDDAHWADMDSGRILAQLFQANSQFCGMLIVIDQDTNVMSPLVDALITGLDCREPTFAQHRIPPLEHTDCRELVHNWSQRCGVHIGEGSAIELVNRSKGNPFLLRELFRTYLDTLSRKKTDENWLEGDHDDAGIVLQRRFAMLSGRAEQILQFLAIADEPLGFHQLQMATRIMPDQLLAELNQLSSKGWLRLYGATLDSEIEISHDRFREVVLQAIPEERLFRRHCRIARTLSAETPPPWRRIAYHYDAARRFREAAACYLEGARAAARIAAFPEALWMLDRAVRPEADRSQEESYQVERLRADCLTGNGSALAAAKLYDRLRESATDPSERMLVECLAGEQWLRCGHLQVGLSRLSPALACVGVNLDARSLRSRLGLLSAAANLLWMKPTELANSLGVPAFSQIEQCLNRVSSPLGFLDNLLGAALVTQLANLALKKGTMSDRAQAFSLWSVVLSFSSRSHQMRALWWFKVARTLGRRSNSPGCIAKGHMASFLRYTLQGRCRKALQYHQRAQQQFHADATLDPWERGFLKWIELKHLWCLGELKSLCAHAQAYRADALERQDEMAIYWMHIHGAHLSDLIEGNTTQARKSIDLAAAVVGESPFQTPQVFLCISRVRQFLYDGQPTAARELLIRCWPEIQRTHVIKVDCYAWTTYELRICCNIACIVSGIGDRQKYLKDARRYVSKLLRLSRSVMRAHALGFLLVLDSLSGKVVRSQEWDSVEREVEAADLQLFLVALRWFRSTSHGHESDAMRRWAINFFLSQGCAQPRRLMNVILPLGCGEKPDDGETL